MGTINNDFFANLAKGATWAAGVAFQRSNPLPLDKYSVFETRADAVTYATTNAVAYPGQVVAFVEDNEMKVCVLAETPDEVEEGAEQTYHLDLQEIGGKIDLDNTSLSFNEETGLLEISGFKNAATATLPQKKIADDGTVSIEWVTVDAIVEGDGNTTYTVTPLTRNVGTEETPVNEIYGFTLTPYDAGVAGATTEIKLDVYTKTEVDNKIAAAVKVETDRAVAAEEALDAKIGKASKPESSEGAGDGEVATGLIADIEALQANKADVTYVDNEIAGLEDAISKLNHFTTKIVESTDDVTEAGVLYLIKDADATGEDKYDEYLYIEKDGVGEAVLIGDTTTDLSNYYNKDDIDGKVDELNDAIDAESTARAELAEKVTALEGVDNATQEELETYKGEVSSALDLKADKTALETLETSLYNGSYKVGDETITSNIVEADRDASRLITPDEIAKLSALVLDEDGSVGVSGTISADNVTGLETKVVSVVTGAITEGTNALGIEKGAQVNKIEKVVFNGTEATIVDKVATIAGEYYNKTEADAKVQAVSDVLTQVQSTANTAKSTAEANTTELNTLKGTVDGHTTTINKNTADINTLATKVAIEEGKVGTLESTVSGKADQTTVDNLAEVVGTNTGNITSLTERVSANETAIATKANKADVYTKTEVDAITGTLATDSEGNTKTIVQMIADAQTASTYNDSEVRGLISANTSKIDANTAAITKLNGDDKTEGSVDYKVAQEVAKILNDNDDSDIDTLNEIAAWIISDTTGAAKMNANISANTAAITKLNGDVNTEGSVLAMIAANTPDVATTEVAGIVKASNSENGVVVADDGKMSVHSLNVDKLVQSEDNVIVLNGGSASTVVTVTE